MTLYKIDLHIGTPHNSNSMGMIERFHSTILEIYRLAKYEHKFTDAASVMTYAIMAYNQTIHSVTGLTPFEVVFGHTEGNPQFNVEFDKEYTQMLVKDHVKRTKYLYKYITEKISSRKEKIHERSPGETNIYLPEDETVFYKGVNTRRSKDKPRYKKGKVKSKVSRNIVEIETNRRNTKVPVKDIRRPPQVRPTADPAGSDPGPSTSKG